MGEGERGERQRVGGREDFSPAVLVSLGSQRGFSAARLTYMARNFSLLGNRCQQVSVRYIYLERLHYHVSTNLAFMHARFGVSYHWIPELLSPHEVACLRVFRKH